MAKGTPSILASVCASSVLPTPEGPSSSTLDFLQLYVCALAAEDALVVVVDRDGQHTLGLVLTDDILIQALFDLGRGQDVDMQMRPQPGCGPGLHRGAGRALLG